MSSLICPISSDRTNKNTVRITGFLVASTIVLFAFTGNIYIVIALLIDFYIRAFTSLKFSPLSFVAKHLTKLFHLDFISIDKAPKVFAARVGFVFSLTILALSFISPVSSLVVAFILMSFALLESIFNFCVGCVVYTYLVLPFYIKKHA